tara:strand:- start:84 stop:1781 length:1698 start_codon:yes stop_codon:yes gene_type:complete
MPNNTDHTVLADPKNIPWLAADPSTIGTLPSKKIIDQATDTDESTHRSDIDDDSCGDKPSWTRTVPVYAVHGQEGLGGSSSDFDLTWDSSAKDDCTAPAEKSELFVNMRNNTSKLQWDESLKEDQAYYIAVPNEQYKLLIKHFIYKFPDFLRDDNGAPVNEVDREDNKSYSDIRSILFENLTEESNQGNSEGVKPYVPGCACTTSDPPEPADGNHAPNTDAKPYADINLAFTDAIVPGSEKTMEYIVKHKDLAQMSYCYCRDTKNSVFNFKIAPVTRFGSQDVNEIMQNQLKALSNYITDGQYAVFYVDFSPVDAKDCYDQVGFRYAFAFNLKDRPVKQNPPACQADPCFVAKHDDVRVFEREDGTEELQEDFGYNTAPKLYDVPQNIIEEYFISPYLEKDPKKVQYPGKIYMQYDTEGNDITSRNVTDCLYLAGRKVDPANKHRGEGKANLTYHFKLEQPMLGIKTSSKNLYIENNQNEFLDITTPHYTQEEILAESPLNTDSTYGLSTVTQTLAQEKCNKYNSVVSHQDGSEDSNEYNVHLNINFDVHTKIAENNTSIFGTYQ